VVNNLSSFVVACLLAMLTQWLHGYVLVTKLPPGC
jgi:hypothetical protein